MAGQIVNRGKNVWLVRVFLGRDARTGKRGWENRTVHGTKKDAQRVVADMLRERDAAPAGRGVVKASVNSLLDDLVSDYRINGRSIDWCELVVRVHLKPYFGDMMAAKVDSGTIRSYIEHRKQPDVLRERGPAANATINRELSLLRRAFNLAAREDPPRVGRVPRIPKLEENNVRKGFFEDADYTALLMALPEHLRPLLAFAYFTGCRKGEVLGLKWQQVDLLRGIVRLEVGETKNDDGRMIPLADDLLEMLKIQRLKRDAGFPSCEWVFFHEDGRGIKSLSGSWAEACRKAGLWDEAAKKPTRLFHDLRRSGVRNLVRAGVPEKVAQTISGHKTRAVFERYNITSESDLLSAAVKLQAHLNQQRKAARESESDSWRTIGAQEGKATKN